MERLRADGLHLPEADPAAVSASDHRHPRSAPFRGGGHHPGGETPQVQAVLQAAEDHQPPDQEQGRPERPPRQCLPGAAPAHGPLGLSDHHHPVHAQPLPRPRRPVPGPVRGVSRQRNLPAPPPPPPPTPAPQPAGAASRGSRAAARPSRGALAHFPASSSSPSRTSIGAQPWAWGRRDPCGLCAQTLGPLPRRPCRWCGRAHGAHPGSRLCRISR
ncbi:proline-rich proteoglycan 2-like [Gracilinanus agilis]|uniref:proline-rich proteoglycan 2-like n=1 Tax=Gracilinanus agilis TaxID=191870 RepID=UPI001CFF2425|nr:proline-rich proteoglycan 2-like [Gracilinanus agilis]